jgi:hypothetical protein
MSYAFDSAANEAAIAARYTGAEVEKGSMVEVFKGRKVPVGTVGKVFWIGASDWGGYRVGLNDRDTGETHWTAEDNVRVVVEDKDEAESWTEYDARKRAEAAEAEAKRVNRWDIVVVKAEPEFVGKVFWTDGNGRLGVAREGARRVRVNGQLRNKPEDVRWVNADEVCKREFWEPELAEVPEPEEPENDDFDDDDLGCF